MKLDIKRLRTFLAVADELGFARAGARLGLAQPAVSKHVRDLEQLMGGRLFERRADGVRLTEAGKLLLAEARILLQSVTAMERRVRGVAQGDEGSLTIGYNETVSWNSVIPRAIRKFRAQNPGVRLTLVPMLSIDQIDALRERRIDAGFMFPWGNLTPDFQSRKLLTTPVMLGVRAGSRWANKASVRLKELADEPVIFFPRRIAPVYHDTIMARCAEAGVQLNVVQEVFNESAALSLVAVGMGVTFLPETARHRCPAGVRIIKPAGLNLVVTLDLVWRLDDAAHPLIVKLVRAVA